MKQKITIIILFCCSVFNYGQTVVINDFETGSPTVTSQFGNTFAKIANTASTDNTSANIGEIRRTTGEWFSLIYFPLNASYIVPAGESRYLHVLIKYPAQADITVRFDGSVGDPNGSTDVRALNKYTDIGNWQDIVFQVDGGGSGRTITHMVMLYDLGFNNVPSGQVIDNVSNFALLDNFKFTESAASELQNTWLGTTADWSSSSNWSRDIPSPSLGIIVPTGVTEPVVGDNTAIETDYLNIASGTAINISNGSSLIVNKQAISPPNSIKYSRTLTSNSDPTKAWHLVTSPIAGVFIANFISANTLASGTTNTNFRGIGNYQNNGSGFNYYLDGYAGTDAFFLGQGYAVKNAAAGDVEFTGFMRNSDGEYGISQGTTNFNLIGNPYLSYMNLGTFLTENNAVADRLSEPTIWLWDPNANAGNGGYITKMSGTDAAFEIAPGQAFFVSAGSAASNKVSFSKANQSHKTDTFLKNTNSRTEIELKVTQDNLITSTNLYFIEGTTTGFDSGFDGSMFDGVSSDLSIYSSLINEDKKLSVQSLPNSDFDAMIVPIGLKAVAGKEITIATNSINLPNGINIYLEDRLNNTFTNLNNQSFKINLTENINGTGRFYLRTSSQVLSTDFTELAGVQVFKKNNSILTIRGLLEGSKTGISIFNTLGKQVLNSSFTATNNLDIALPKFATGMYIVKLQTAEGSLNKKIIIE